MEIIVNPKAKGLIVSHRGSEIQWELKTWPRVTENTTENLFSQINYWFSTMKPEVQDDIFGIYSDAYKVISEESDSKIRDTSLTDLSTRLLNYFDLYAIRQWIESSPEDADVWIDPSFDEEPDPDHPKEQTYTRQEYIDLVAMVIAVKAMLPIWGEYNTLAQHEVGSDHKERKALELISKSNIEHCAAKERLYVYAEAWADKKKASSQTAITRDRATEDNPKYFLAMLLVRRSTTHPLGFKLKHLIKDAYNYLNGQSSNMTAGPSEKRRSRKGGGGEEEDAVTESIRLAQDVATFRSLCTNEYVNNPHLVLDMYLDFCRQDKIKVGVAIKTDIDDKLMHERLDAKLKELEGLASFCYSEFHSTICGAVLGDVILPEFIADLDHFALRCVVGVSSVILTELGFRDLEALITAERFAKDPTKMTMSGMAIKGLPPTLSKKLDQVYPYRHMSVASKGPGRYQATPAKSNVAGECIVNIVRFINCYDWSVSQQEFYELRSSLANLFIMVTGGTEK